MTIFAPSSGLIEYAKWMGGEQPSWWRWTTWLAVGILIVIDQNRPKQRSQPHDAPQPATTDPGIERLIRELREDEPRPLLMRAIEVAVNDALGEVARQQGGIAIPIGRKAQERGIEAGRSMLQRNLQLIMAPMANTLERLQDEAAKGTKERDEISEERDRFRAGLQALTAQVDQTNPQCPIGIALTCAGLSHALGPKPTYQQLLVQVAELEAQQFDEQRVHEVVKSCLRAMNQQGTIQAHADAIAACVAKELASVPCAAKFA